MAFISMELRIQALWRRKTNSPCLLSGACNDGKVGLPSQSLVEGFCCARRTGVCTWSSGRAPSAAVPCRNWTEALSAFISRPGSCPGPEAEAKVGDGGDCLRPFWNSPCLTESQGGGSKMDPGRKKRLREAAS